SDPMVDCLLTKKRYRADQIEPQSGIQFQYLGAISEANWKKINDEVFYQSNVSSPPENFPKYDRLKRSLQPDGDILKVAGGDEEIIDFLKQTIMYFSNQPYSILLPPGKPPESAHKIARMFYTRG